MVTKVEKISWMAYGSILSAITMGLQQHMSEKDTVQRLSLIRGVSPSGLKRVTPKKGDDIVYSYMKI